MNLSTSSTEIWIVLLISFIGGPIPVAHVESFPYYLSAWSTYECRKLTMINRLMTRFGSSIQQYTCLWVQLSSNSIEQPSMRIDLFGILLFEDKDDLDRNLEVSYDPG